MADNKKIAQDVLNAVGGAANVTSVSHCMTRLRFNLKDMSIPNDKTVGGLDGVVGVVQSGGQYQVIIGQNVPKVYAEICNLGGFAQQAAVNENLDAPKEKLTPKTVGMNIMNYLSGTMVQMIPIMMAAGMIKMLLAVLGPDFLGLITTESDTYILLDFLYDAGFYFLPIFLGFYAAQKLDILPILGAYMGAILIAPDFVALAATEGASFHILGIPVTLNNYSQTVLPIFLSVWVMSYIYKALTKVIPDTMSTIFTPFLTMLIMAPISLCALAPLGSLLGNYISGGLLAFGEVGGFVAVALVAALWEFLVMTGMHGVIIMFMLNQLFTTGVMTGVCTSGTYATFAAFGVALGAFLRLKNKKDKATNFGFFLSGFLGGVTEPVLYGTCFKYKRTFLALMLGGLIGGAYAGITGVDMYVLGSTNVLMVLGFAGGNAANLVNGIIGCALAFVVSTVATYLIGFTKADIEGAAE